MTNWRDDAICPRGWRGGIYDFGWLTFYLWDLDAYRPCIWLRFRGGWLVLFLGWQLPSLVWLR